MWWSLGQEDHYEYYFYLNQKNTSKILHIQTYPQQYPFLGVQYIGPIQSISLMCTHVVEYYNVEFTPRDNNRSQNTASAPILGQLVQIFMAQFVVLRPSVDTSSSTNYFGH